MLVVTPWSAHPHTTNHTFCSPHHPQTQVPDTNDIDTFRSAIEQLPGTESPEIFGLHSNADVTFRTLQVRMCVYCACVKAQAQAPSGVRPELVLTHFWPMLCV